MPNWQEILSEIHQTQSNLINQANAIASGASAAIDSVRRKYLSLLFEKTNRNIISYYSGFLSKPENLSLDINDEDKNGFMSAIHQLDRRLGLDLILHTPGGRIAATQSIVNYLQKMFDGDIRAIIPQIAMSGGHNDRLLLQCYFDGEAVESWPYRSAVARFARLWGT